MAETTSGWEHFPHGADVGLCGYGPTLAAAFEQTALAMTAAIVDPDSIEPSRKVEIVCEAPDPELLLVDWLNSLVYEMATRGLVFGRFAVRIEGNKLSGSAWGEVLSRERHAPTVEVKGATYTALSVAREPGGNWVARCVVDV